MMHGLVDMMRVQALHATQGRATVRVGLVDSYDPPHYRAKVRLQPENVLTGWLPIVSPWVGNGWGWFAPPSIGDLVEVQFQEDHLEAGFVCQRFYNDVDRPLPVPEKECWLVHSSGSALKFRNDGSVELQTAQHLHATVGGDAHLTVSGHLHSRAAQWQHTGDMTMTGNVVIKGDAMIDGNQQVTGQMAGEGGLAVSGGDGAAITGRLAVTGGDVTAEGISLAQHTHGGVKPGDGHTGEPQ